MKLFLRFFILSLIFMSQAVFAEDKQENTEGKSLKVAIVNFQKLVVESNLGKKYLKSQRSNIEKKQSILNKLEDQVRNMRDSFEEKRLVLDEKARDEIVFGRSSEVEISSNDVFHLPHLRKAKYAVRGMAKATK